MPTLKDNRIANAMTVGEMPYDTPFSSYAFLLEAQYLPTKLYVRHIGRQLMGVVESATVYVLRRVILDKVTIGFYPHAVLEQLGLRRADVGQVSYRIIQCINWHKYSA